MKISEYEVMKLNIRKFQKGGSSKLPTFSLPEINI